jgi:c-di-GMP-binding flagellar brake protein YcgR
MSSERRVQKRVRTSVSADINTGAEAFTVRATNLSQGGVGLVLSRPLEADINVALSLFLVEDGVEDATSTPLEVHCRVIWVTQSKPTRWEAGLRFFELDSQQNQQLGQFIGRMLQRGD